MTESFCLNPSSVQSPPNKMVDRETEICHRMCLEIKVWRWPGYHRCAMLCCAALSRLVVRTAVGNENIYRYKLAKSPQHNDYVWKWNLVTM